MADKPHPASWLWAKAQNEAAAEKDFDGSELYEQDPCFRKKYSEIWDTDTIDAPESDKSRKPRSSSKRRKPRDASSPGGAILDEKENSWCQSAQSRLLTAQLEGVSLMRARTSFRAWKRGMSALWNALAAGRMSGSLTRKFESKAEVVRLLFADDLDALQTEWLARTADERRILWPDLMLGSLMLAPETTHDLLQATYDELSAPFYVVEDVMMFLTKRASILDSERQKETWEALCNMMVFLFENSEKRRFQLRQNRIYRVIKNASPESVAKLFIALQQNDHPLRTDTLLQFAGRLASEARFKAKALDILRSLLNKRLLDYNSPHALALSTAIVSFKKGVDTKDLQVSPAKLFEELLAMGLRPNVIHYTCIMRNLCLHKEVDAAWKVFEIMLEHNIEPDATTYSVLISGAKLIGDVQTVGSVLNAAMSRNAYNRVHLNDLLHAIFLPILWEARENQISLPRLLPAFRPMLQAYCHFFRLDPLQRLALSDLASLLEFRQDQSSSLRWASVHQVTAVIQSLPSFPPEELLEPDGATLGIMLIGYIKALPTAYTLVAFYSQFRAQLKLGDPATIAIVRETGTLVYDTIIKALTEWDGMLRVALDIMGEMLKDAASVASATSAAPATCTAAGSPAPGLSASDARASEHVETDVSATQASPSGSSPSNSSQPVSGPADCPSAASSDSPASDPAAVSAPAGDACDLSMLTRHPVPSVYTWSILLHGFMHRGQTEQGERILQTMREHGVTPTVVTWNTLLAGYTRLQKLQLAVRTLARMERAGLRHDDFTIRGFGYLANKKRAVDMVHNRLRQRKEQLEKQIEREWRREVGGASAEKLQQLQEQMDHVRSTMGEDQIDPRSGAWDVQRHVDEQRQAARSV